LAVRNLAAINEEAASLIVAAGAIPVQVELLRGGSDEDKENAAMVIMNLAIGSTAVKVAIVEAGAVFPLMDLSHDGSDDGKMSAKIALSNLTHVYTATERNIIIFDVSRPAYGS
jgi:hypothetical protein